MKQQSQEHLKKFGLTLLINIVLPGLGNLAVAARSPGNFLALLFSILAYNSHDWRIILAWYLLMGVKAYIDIYLDPRQKAVPTAIKDADDSAVKVLDSVHRTDESDGQHFDRITEASERALHASYDEVQSYFADNLPEGKVAHPQPHKDLPQQLSHGEAQGLEHSVPEDHSKFKHPYASLATEAHDSPSFSRGAPQALQMTQAEEKHNFQQLQFVSDEAKTYSHGVPLPLNQALKHAETVSESEHSLKIPQHEKQVSHAMPVALNELPQVAHEAGLTPEQDGKKQKHDLHLLNQEKALEIGSEPALTTEGDKDNRSEPASEDDFASITDLYDDGSTTESSPSPFANAPARHKVELCPTCQRQRSHNRPVCPACGTHFEQGSV